MSKTAKKRTTKEFIPTDDDRNNVALLAAYGIPQDQIAQLIRNPHSGEPIGEATLKRKFKHELDTGGSRLLARVANSLVQNATVHNNVAAQIFLLKTRGKGQWRENDFDGATLKGKFGGMPAEFTFNIARANAVDDDSENQGS